MSPKISSTGGRPSQIVSILLTCHSTGRSAEIRPWTRVSAAQAANPHFKRNGSPVCTVTQTGSTSSTTCRTVLAGLGNDDLLATVTVTGFAVYQCQKQGGNVAPGQNKVLVGPATAPTFIDSERNPASRMPCKHPAGPRKGQATAQERSGNALPYPGAENRVQATRALHFGEALNDGGWYRRSGRHHNAAVAALAFAPVMPSSSRPPLCAGFTRGPGVGWPLRPGHPPPAPPAPPLQVHTPFQGAETRSCSTTIRAVPGSPRIRKWPAVGSWMLVAPGRMLPSGMCGSKRP